MNSEITILRDIPYLGAERAEKMDVYLPPATFEGPRPAILLIHGGGWRIGDKADNREKNIGNNLAANGYAVFSINYLLNIGEKNAEGKMEYSLVAWPRNLYDCKTALRYIRHEHQRFGIDPERIATMGGSAGGTFAMLLGATMQHEAVNNGGEYREQNNAVKCVLNFYGPIDVRGKRAAIFAGATEEESQANAELGSPIVQIADDFPPMFIAHGSADKITPVEDTRVLVEHLRQKGLDYWYVEIAGAPHTFHLEPEQMDLRPVVLSFLKKHLGT